MALLLPCGKLPYTGKTTISRNHLRRSRRSPGPSFPSWEPAREGAPPALLMEVPGFHRSCTFSLLLWNPAPPSSTKILCTDFYFS